MADEERQRESDQSNSMSLLDVGEMTRTHGHEPVLYQH